MDLSDGARVEKPGAPFFFAGMRKPRLGYVRLLLDRGQSPPELPRLERILLLMLAMADSTSTTHVRHSHGTPRGIATRSVRRKLSVAYFLSFVLPTAFYLVCVAELAISGGLPALTKLTLFIGVPSVTAMSLGGFLLLLRPLRCVERLSADVEAVAAASGGAQDHGPETWDEAQRVAYYVTHMMDDYQARLSTMDSRTRKLQEANQQLMDLALTDPLTGLYNRRFAMTTLNTEVQRSIKHGHPLSVLLIDPDDFGMLTELLDQPTKILVLRQLGEVIDNKTRRLDLVARYGSERFLVILLDTAMDGAVRIAERIRTAVAEHAFGVPNGTEKYSLTVSIGIGAFSGDVGDSEKVLEVAESSLAIAQRTGTNMVWA